jgi:hypothetical protein
MGPLSKRSVLCRSLRGTADERSAAAMIQEIEFAPDSPLEGDGFELSVPAGRVCFVALCLLAKDGGAPRFSSLCPSRRAVPWNRGRIRVGRVAVYGAAPPLARAVGSARRGPWPAKGRKRVDAGGSGLEGVDSLRPRGTAGNSVSPSN